MIYSPARYGIRIFKFVTKHRYICDVYIYEQCFAINASINAM